MLRRNYVILILLALILFSPQAAFHVLAEDSSNKSVYENINDEEQTQNPDETNIVEDDQVSPDANVQGDALSVTAFDFIKMFFALGIVLFLIYFLLKFVTKRNRVFQQGQAIINLGGTNVGQNKSVQMVKIGDRVLVVGVGESISLLTEINDEEESKKIIQEFEQKHERVVESKDFIQKVFSFIQQGAKGQKHNESPMTFSTKLSEQLEKMKKERTKQIEDIERKGLDKHE
ncbi:flagellar biosynthetic protein FliO [Metabacillus sp. YM-086]|uniref:flagellar biosynthetic protein FliO n=1 Tax=Metabacillus sp. YM-086 TaxID=3341729 RepID=UPI003A83891B